jgi:hypothetical protein
LENSKSLHSSSIDPQILALAARIERWIDHQEFMMRLKEKRRVEQIKRRYLDRYRPSMQSTSPTQRKSGSFPVAA